MSSNLEGKRPCNRRPPLIYALFQFRTPHDSHERQPPAAQGENDKEDDPHLVVAGPEVTDVRRLEVAHLGAAFLLRVAGGRVLVSVFPSVVQQQEHNRDKEDR